MNRNANQEVTRVSDRESGRNLLSRRRLLGLGASAAATVVFGTACTGENDNEASAEQSADTETGQGIIIITEASTPTPTPEAPTPSPTPEMPALSDPFALEESPDLYANFNGMTPQEIRQIAENEPFENLVRAFQIKLEDIQDPKDYPFVYADVMQTFIMSGATPDELSQFEGSIGTEYQDTMGEKYDMAMYIALFGTDGMRSDGAEYTEDEIRNDEAYQFLQDIHKAALTRYIDNARWNNNLNEVAYVSVTEANTPVRINDKLHGKFTAYFDLCITNNRPETSVNAYNIDGPAVSFLTPNEERGVYEHSFSFQDEYRSLFDRFIDLAA